jgi:hypothetical protein
LSQPETGMGFPGDDRKGDINDCGVYRGYEAGELNHQKYPPSSPELFSLGHAPAFLKEVIPGEQQQIQLALVVHRVN